LERHGFSDEIVDKWLLASLMYRPLNSSTPDAMTDGIVTHDKDKTVLCRCSGLAILIALVQGTPLFCREFSAANHGDWGTRLSTSSSVARICMSYILGHESLRSLAVEGDSAISQFEGSTFSDSAI
jgi:hypothetical protein